MTRYPKLLSWKASKFEVEDEQAKLLWDQTVFFARLFGLSKDYETINESFDKKLEFCGKVNKQFAVLFNPILPLR